MLKEGVTHDNGEGSENSEFLLDTGNLGTFPFPISIYTRVKMRLRLARNSAQINVNKKYRTVDSAK